MNVSNALTPHLIRPEHLEPNWRWDRAIPSHGHMSVDFERRIDFDRLRHYRLARARQALKNSPCGALLLFDVNNIRYVSGTKIGECLAEFNRWHARRVIHSRTCVMILSDGYDTGAPELLEAAMRGLRRRCKRIVWLNPLLGSDAYEPSARGMQAALPFLDLFAPAHDIESLAALEPYLARI